MADADPNIAAEFRRRRTPQLLVTLPVVPLLLLFAVYGENGLCGMPAGYTVIPFLVIIAGVHDVCAVESGCARQHVP